MNGSVIEQGSGLLAHAGAHSRRPVWVGGLAAALAWLAAATLTVNWPDARQWDRTEELALLMTIISSVLLLVVVIDRLLAPVATRLREKAPWLLVLAALVRQRLAVSGAARHRLRGWGRSSGFSLASASAGRGRWATGCTRCCG